MSDFTDIYKELVILQYYSKEKAQAEIKLWSDEFENVYSFLNQFFTEFDLDQATGDRLDKIGKIVGQSRIVEGGVAKKFFGYLGAPNSLGYNEGRYFTEGDDLFTDSELTDGQYKIFIKAKVSKNNASAIITGNGRDGLQDAIQLLFNGSGYVYDNQDMSLNLYIDNTFSENDLDLIIKANLLPKPQAVRYRWIVQTPTLPFGYLGAPNSAGYGVGEYSKLLGTVFPTPPVPPPPSTSKLYRVHETSSTFPPNVTSGSSLNALEVEHGQPTGGQEISAVYFIFHATKTELENNEIIWQTSTSNQNANPSPADNGQAERYLYLYNGYLEPDDSLFVNNTFPLLGTQIRKYNAGDSTSYTTTETVPNLSTFGEDISIIVIFNSTNSKRDVVTFLINLIIQENPLNIIRNMNIADLEFSETGNDGNSDFGELV